MKSYFHTSTVLLKMLGRAVACIRRGSEDCQPGGGGAWASRGWRYCVQVVAS